MVEKGETLRYLEDLIDELGGFGRFQCYLFIGMYTIYSVAGWSLMQMIYSGMVPPWRCITSHDLIQEKENGLLNDTDTYTYRSHSEYFTTTISTTSTIYSHTYDHNETLNVCSVNGTSCEMFVFLTSSRTIINQWNLICDRKWVKQIVISLQMFGVWLGTGVSGQLGDRYGRKKVFYIFSLFHTILNVLGGLSVNWQMYVTCQLLIGTQAGGLLTVSFPYGLELFPDKARTLIGLVPLFGIGACIFSGVAAMLDNWSHIHFACAIFNVPYLLGWFYFPDSIRWLAVHGRLEEAMDAIRKIARTNRRPVPCGTEILLDKIAMEEREIRRNTKPYTYLDVFKKSKVRKTVLIQGYFMFSLSIAYYGISFGMSNLDGDIFLNTFLFSAMTIASSVTMIFIADKFERRTWALSLSSIIILPSAACVITLLIPTDFNVGGIINGLSLTIYTLTYPLWCIISLWGTELLPTVVRNLGYAWFNSAARFAAMVCPFAMNFDDSLIIPYVIIVILLALGFLLCFLLPETRGHVLADSFAKETGVEANKSTYAEANNGEDQEAASQMAMV